MALLSISALVGSGIDLTSPTLGALQTNITAQSVSVGSSEIKGQITFSTGGTAPGAGATILLISFPDNWPTLPSIDVGDMSGHAASYAVTAVTFNSFSVVAATALVASTNYTIGYQILS